MHANKYQVGDRLLRGIESVRKATRQSKIEGSYLPVNPKMKDRTNVAPNPEPVACLHELIVMAHKIKGMMELRSETDARGLRRALKR